MGAKRRMKTRRERDRERENMPRVQEQRSGTQMTSGQTKTYTVSEKGKRGKGKIKGTDMT